jgi:hypothetical protein
MASRELRLALAAIVLGAVAATSLVWASSTTPTENTCNASSSGGTPLGTALAFGTITEAFAGIHHWYNASVESSEALLLKNLEFGVINQSDSIVPPGHAWSFSLRNGSGDLVNANYTVNGLIGEWATGSSLPLDSGESFSLQTSPENISGVGDAWIFSEVGTYSNGCPAEGQTTLQIP